MDSLKHHVVNLENCGPVSVFLQGNLEKQRDSAAFLTVHDVGSSYTNWVDWVMDASMEEVRKRSLFIHVALPGQEPGAEELPQDFIFPKMQELGMTLVTVLDHLRISRVVGLGDGAGANIITRFGMCHPARVHGIVTINNTASASLGRFMDSLKEKIKAFRSYEKKYLNEKNVAKFAEAYKKRTDILLEMNKKINFDVLLIAGTQSKYVGDTEAIHKQMPPGLCSMIKVEEVSEPLLETPAKTAEAVLLFCQGLCLLPAVQQIKGSSRQARSGFADDSKTAMSMRDYDRPNIRRLSLTPV